MNHPAAIDPAVCPLCGRPNHCELAARGNHEGPCWCWEVRPAPEALRRIPPEARRRACLCRDCLSRRDWPEESAP